MDAADQEPKSRTYIVTIGSLVGHLSLRWLFPDFVSELPQVSK